MGIANAAHETECFLCHGEIKQNEDHIFWMGTSDIHLHKDCAPLLVAHLQSDFVRLLSQAPFERYHLI